MEEKINLNQLGDEQPDPSLADLEMEVRLLEWTISKKMKVAKLLQNLSYDNATRKLSIVYGNDVTLPNFNVPKGYINGYQLTKVTNDLKIGAGICTDSTDTATIVNIELTKLYANWGEGNNAGILDDGSFELNRMYYLFAILKNDNITTDYLCSLSRTSPVLPTDYTYFRLIGCFYGMFQILVQYNVINTFNETGLDLPINYSYNYSFLNFTTYLLANGFYRDSTNKKNIILDSSVQKYFTYPFVVESGESGFVDAITNNTDYFIYALYNENTGAVDICYKISANNTLPTGFTHYKLIGYIYIDSLGIVNTIHINDENGNFNVNATKQIHYWYKNITFTGTQSEILTLMPSSAQTSKHAIFNDTDFEITVNSSLSKKIQGDNELIIPAHSNVILYFNKKEWKLL